MMENADEHQIFTFCKNKFPFQKLLEFNSNDI